MEINYGDLFSEIASSHFVAWTCTVLVGSEGQTINYYYETIIYPRSGDLIRLPLKTIQQFLDKQDEQDEMA